MKMNKTKILLSGIEKCKQEKPTQKMPLLLMVAAFGPI
jgi:hypothetical protein